MLERTDAITNEVLEPITFVLAYPTVFFGKFIYLFYIFRAINDVQNPKD